MGIITVIHECGGIRISFLSQTVTYPSHVPLFLALTFWVESADVTSVFIADLAKPLSKDKAQAISRLLNGIPVYYLGLNNPSWSLVAAMFPDTSILIVNQSGGLGEHTIGFTGAKLTKQSSGWQDNLALIKNVSKHYDNQKFEGKSAEELKQLGKSLMRRKYQDFLLVSMVEAKVLLLNWVNKNKLNSVDFRIMVTQLISDLEAKHPADKKLGDCFDNRAEFNSVLLSAMVLCKEKINNVHYLRRA